MDEEKDENWDAFKDRLDDLHLLWTLIQNLQFQYATNANPKIVKDEEEDAEELDLKEFKDLAAELMMIDPMLKKAVEEQGMDRLFSISVDIWMNKSNDNQRHNALAKLGRYLVTCMFPSCKWYDCEHHPRDFPFNMSSLFELDHDTMQLGSGSPYEIAKKQGVVPMIEEVKDTKCQLVCSLHHDRGEGSRKKSNALAASKSICLVTSKQEQEYRSPRAVVLNEDKQDPITSIKFTFFLLECQARNVTRSSTHWGTMVTLAHAYFGIALDNMYKYNGTYYEKHNSRYILFNEFLAEIISYLCGRCADPTCKDGDLRNRPPFSTARVWDHDEKKSEAVTSLSKGNTFYMLNELLSWTVPLCCVSDAIRTSNQRNGCARRCYAIGGCTCKKYSNPLPMKVVITNKK